MGLVGEINLIGQHVPYLSLTIRKKPIKPPLIPEKHPLCSRGNLQSSIHVMCCDLQGKEMLDRRAANWARD